MFGFKTKTQRKETFIEVLCNLLSCWLITVGTSIIFDSYFEVRIGVSTIVWQTLIAVAAAVLLTKRWWVPLVSLLALISISLITAYFLTDIRELFKLIIGFFKWWFSACPSDSQFYSDKAFYAAHTIINICVGIFYYSLLRITKRAWVVAAFALGVVIFSSAQGYSDYDLLAIPFLVAGIFPFVASEKFQTVNFSKFKNLFGALDKKWLFIIVSTTVIVAICITSVGVITAINGSIRTRECTDIVSDIQSFTGIYTREQKRRNVSLFDLGLVENSTYVGGDLPYLNAGTLATTNLTSPSLVKITAFDTFDGLKWKNSFKKSYRINGPWEKQEQKYLSTRLIEDDYFLYNIKKVAKVQNVEITLGRGSHVIPTVGQVYNFEEITDNKNQVLFDTCGRLLSYYGQEAGFKYSFDTVIYDTKDPTLGKKIRTLIAHFGNANDPLFDKDGEFYKAYTSEVKTESGEIEKIIYELGFDIENYYDKAYKICEYFSAENGFVYTNNPPLFEKGENIVDKLLETKRGHCVYYATAMLAMTRSAGIPSRLAVGYRTVTSSKTQLQKIDRSAPYAWVECYIPHIGWVSFDPSPAKGSPGGYFQGLQSIGGSEPDIKNEIEYQAPGTALEWTEGPNIPLLILASILVSIIICAFINSLFSNKYYSLCEVRKRYPNTIIQASFYYKDILRQFYWLGFKFKKGETINELSKRTCDEINQRYARKISKGIDEVEELCFDSVKTNTFGGEETLIAREALEKVFAQRHEEAFEIVSKAITVIESIRYGNETPTDEQIQTVFDAHEALENVLKDKENKIFYYLKRRVLLPKFFLFKK